MKKIVLLVTLFLIPLYAIDLVVDMGSGVHYAGSSGKLIYQKDFFKDSSAEINHDTSANVYLWMELQSDQKYWPKVRFETTRSKTEGSSFVHISAGPNINQLLKALDKLPLVNINDTYYDSVLTLDTYESFLYYEYFEESSFPSLGFGLGVKKFDFNYRATIIDGLVFHDNGGDLVPMLYLKSRYELDKKQNGTRINTEVDGKIYVFGDSDIYDYLVKVDFLKKYNETTDLGLEIGFKETYFNIKGGDIANVGGDMKSSGIYFGFIGHFK